MVDFQVFLSYNFFKLVRNSNFYGIIKEKGQKMTIYDTLIGFGMYFWGLYGVYAIASQAEIYFNNEFNKLNS